jgi:glycosyltransferase involved in cell wall biosynthesis
MTGAVTAFYTPLKHPFQSEPSGDRELARTLLEGLEAIGFAPALASRLSTWCRAFEPAAAIRVERIAALVAATLVGRYRRRPPAERPRLWVTYQAYHRAPDLLGPAVADALRVPYVLVDTAVSAKSRRSPFRPWVSAARRAVRRADLIFLLSPRDQPTIARLRGPRFAAERLLLLPPAVDLARFTASAEARDAHRTTLGRWFPGESGPLILVVAAMRDDKVEAYRRLAAALEALVAEGARPWRLAVVGDGPARPRIEAAFAGLPRERLAWLGTLEPGALAPAYLGADLFAFPGRFHMAYLQASAAGLPVLACEGPDPDAWIVPGGALQVPATPRAFAAGLARLLDDAPLRAALGAAGRRQVAETRTLDGFRDRLAQGLGRVGLP